MPNTCLQDWWPLWEENHVSGFPNWANQSQVGIFVWNHSVLGKHRTGLIEILEGWHLNICRVLSQANKGLCKMTSLYSCSTVAPGFWGVSVSGKSVAESSERVGLTCFANSAVHKLCTDGYKLVYLEAWRGWVNACLAYLKTQVLRRNRKIS